MNFPFQNTVRAEYKRRATVLPMAIQKRAENSWILLIKESVLESAYFTIITLPHPSNGKPTKYCLDYVYMKMYEIITFTETYRSWFLAETVKSDGSLLMMTPINPLFLVIPRLREMCYNHAIPLTDLLSARGFDKIIDFVPDLSTIADLRGPPNMKAYKYNENKTLTWLQNRITKLTNVLKEKKINVTAGATSATFVSSSLENVKVEEEVYIKYAFGIVSEYLQEDLASDLEKLYDFTPDFIETVGRKRRSNAEINNVIKKIKQEPIEDIPEDDKSSVITQIKKEKDLITEVKEENVVITEVKKEKVLITEVKKEKVLTAKEKAKKKAAKGTKTISSFFKKK